ncbi:MAG: DNA-directed RNA polymerase subunit beta', partial [Ignavibacteria bacterium]
MPYRVQENAMRDVSSITISLASPDDILSRSHGEVTKPETINYRSFRPEKDGLFCEKIFGPTRDWECFCGKYKRIRYKGIICDRCGVEVTQKSVRRERMGHIGLAVPVVHIWFFRAQPSKIGNIIGISLKELEKVIYYESYIVINPGPTGLSRLDLISEDQYFEVLNSVPAGNEKLEDSDPKKFIAKIGGDAVKEILKNTDIESLSKELRDQLKEETSQQKKSDLLKRLRVVESFKEKEGKVPNKPEWMVLNYIPVIPPELRPLVPLEGGRFATSDLNDLYRRVIIRNNRLKRLIDIKAPEVILRNEKRMLQEAVDALFDNSRRGSAVRSDNNRPLKSLSDMLKGKQGRFRQNLLGKRVDYSGRSVIVVGPEVKLHQCGLPKDMAVELFKPFIIRKLIERGHNKTVKSARKVVDRKDPIIWDILEKIITGHPIMLNRAPTLHRLGIQAFQPVLIDGRAIQLHPMVCTAFNADFDGDQMAVHVPLSYEAQLEAAILMLSSHNILSPQNGSPIVVPTQDIVLGCYYLTKLREGDKGEGMLFSSPEEVIMAYNNKILGLHARIKVKIDNQLIETTTGRVIFNRIVPKEMGFFNQLLIKKTFGGFIGQMFMKMGNKVAAKFLDDLKELGFRYATAAGLFVSYGDMIIPDEKETMISRANKEVEKILSQHEQGVITDSERYNKIIDVWTHTTNDVARALMEKLRQHNQGFNSLHMMVDSGARGSQEQVRQLAGMRGLMMKPQKTLSGQAGEIIESPIVANFKEGLSVLEYFISTHGTRKGLADTALKT